MEFGVLGPLEVTDSGQRTIVRGSRRVGLLIRMLLSANRVVDAERLVADVWEDRVVPIAPSTLKSHVFVLRELLGADRIATRADGYMLCVEHAELDLVDFEADIHEARLAIDDGADLAAVAALERALGRWRGAALNDVAERSWAQAEAARLEELRQAATESLLDCRLRLGQHHDVVGMAEAAVQAQPLRERRWSSLMLALYRDGRQTDALRAARRLRTMLSDEIGIEPSAELATLELAILQHDPVLDLPMDARDEGSGAAVPANDLARVASRDPPSRQPGAGRLPNYLTSFIGRVDALSAIDAELDARRLLTLVGAGGVGKTRLAVEVARARRDRYRDGVWMVELAGVTSADQIDALAAATLGLTGLADLSPREALLAVVSRWHALIVFDNCEHLPAGVRDAVESLLAASPNVTVLATSRQRLGVAGEQLLHVDPLTPDEAARLFTDRADLVRRADQTDRRDPAVRRICEHLDGMPLAIELAAARTIAMTPTEIEHRLDQRLAFLSDSTARDIRHSSLQHTVDWSYYLLRPSLQEFFAAIGVFAGTFDAAAARDVAEPDDDLAALDALDALVTQSLLSTIPRGSHTIYRMLETMRHYAGQRRSPSVDASLRRRHLSHYAAFADEAWDGCRGPDSERWLERIDAALDDIRAAFHHAVAISAADAAVRIAGGLFMYNHTRRLQELYGWVPLALALPAAGDQPNAGRARLHSAYGAFMSGELATAERAVLSELDRLEPRDPLRPLALFLLSGVYGNQGRFIECDAPTRSSIAAAEQLGPSHDYDQAESMWNQCTVALATGSPDHDRALDLLRFARRLGNARAIAGGLLQAGVTDPDTEQGARLLAEARELTARSRDTYRHGLAIMWAGVLIAEADPIAGLRTIPDVLDQARRTGLGLLVRQLPKYFYPALAEVGQYEAIARLDAASIPICLRPTLTAMAITAARDALGNELYDELKRANANNTAADLEAILTSTLADLI